MRPRAAAACGRTASFRQTERGRQQRPQRGRPGRRPAAPLLVTAPPPTLPRAPGKLRAPISVERPGWGSGPGGGRSSRLHEADCSRGFWNLPATRGAHARGDQPAPRGRAGPQAAVRTHLRTWQTVARAPGTEGRSRPQSGARRVRGNRSPAVARFQARGHTEEPIPGPGLGAAAIAGGAVTLEVAPKLLLPRLGSRRASPPTAVSLSSETDGPCDPRCARPASGAEWGLPGCPSRCTLRIYSKVKENCQGE